MSGNILVYMRRNLQALLDKTTFHFHKKNVVIGNNSFKWCKIPVPENYPMQSQTHPSILYVPERWNGATHWLGTTPYPFGDIRFENPCIYYADQKDENVPTDFVPIKCNPIVDWAGDKSYNSDIELFLKNNTLYAINRVNDGRVLREIELLSSKDGQNWSTPISIYQSNDENRQLLSPSVIEHEDKIYIYFLSGDAGIKKKGHCGGIEIIEGSDLSNPNFKYKTKGVFVNSEITGIQPWHFDLFIYADKLYMVFCGRNIKKKTFRYPMETYLAVSDNFIDFTIYPIPILKHIKTYRPSAYVDEKGIFNLYFSVVGEVAGDCSDRAIALTSIPMSELLNLICKEKI